jgi:capsular polysaccharide biosynthesis protein
MNDQRGRFDFARGGVFDAMLSYPFMVLFVVIVFAAGGVALGYERTTTYTAESELLVGNVKISDAAGIPGVVDASRALAAVYARLIDADAVREDVIQATGEETVGATLAATPIPGTPLIRVSASSDSHDHSIATANAAAQGLSEFVAKINKPGSDISTVFHRYEDAALAYSQQLQRYQHLSNGLSSFSSTAARVQVIQANADLQSAKLKRNALQLLYQRGQAIKAAEPNVKVFLSATTATSDRTSNMKIAGVVGAVAGLALAAALATFRARRRA